MRCYVTNFFKYFDNCISLSLISFVLTFMHLKTTLRRGPWCHQRFKEAQGPEKAGKAWPRTTLEPLTPCTCNMHAHGPKVEVRPNGVIGHLWPTSFLFTHVYVLESCAVSMYDFTI